MAAKAAAISGYNNRARGLALARWRERIFMEIYSNNWGGEEKARGCRPP